EDKCPVLYCLNIKCELRQQQLQQRLQQAQKQHIATKENQGLSGSIPSSSLGDSSTTNQPSPGAQSCTSSHPPQPGVGMKPPTEPAVGVLHAVQQAQATAARQTAPHMVTTAVIDGKGNPVVSPPTLGPDLIATQQQMQAQMQKQPQVMPRPSGPSVNMPRPTTQALQIFQTIKSPTCSGHQRQQALATLESDPQVWEAYIELLLSRTAPIQQQQMFLNKNDIGPPLQLNVWYKQLLHLIDMQRQQEQQQPNQFPLPPMYALCPWMPMPMNFGHQQGFQNKSTQFQFEQQGPQQILMQPQIKQMASPTHPPISPQQGIFNHPEGPVPSPSQQQLMQRVQSPPPTAARLAQAVCSLEPIASPRTQASTLQNQPIPSPYYPAQTESPHPSLSIGTLVLLTGPNKLTTTSDQGSVQTGRNVFSFAYEKSTGRNSNSEKMEIEGDKNSVGKQEPIMDVKPSGKPVSQDADMDVKETTEDGFSASSRVKEEQTVVEKEIASPAPVPSAGKDCVDTKPDSSTQLSKNKTIFKPDELHQALMPTLEELNKQDPEWLPFHHLLPVNMNFCLLLCRTVS
ncbi:hypothetical protein AVEN_243133-1, partial [Araneus ventricosus]